MAGTSIGGINAAVIAGSKDEKHPEQALEQFWIELSEGFVDLDKVVLTSPGSLPKFVEDMMLSSGYGLSASSGEQRNHPPSTMNADERSIKMKQLKSFYSSALLEMIKCLNPDGEKKIV